MKTNRRRLRRIRWIRRRTTWKRGGTQDKDIKNKQIIIKYDMKSRKKKKHNKNINNNKMMNNDKNKKQQQKKKQLKEKDYWLRFSLSNTQKQKFLIIWCACSLVFGCFNPFPPFCSVILVFPFLGGWVVVLKESQTPIVGRCCRGAFWRQDRKILSPHGPESGLPT